MDESYKLWKPKEGLNTLVSQFALLQADRIIQQAREMREQGESEKEVLAFVNSHRDLDRTSRNNIYQLSLGIRPKDNISPDDVVEVREESETTLSLELAGDPEAIEAGTLIFFRGGRWVVVSLKSRKLVLKKF